MNLQECLNIDVIGLKNVARSDNDVKLQDEVDMAYFNVLIMKTDQEALVLIRDSASLKIANHAQGA